MTLYPRRSLILILILALSPSVVLAQEETAGSDRPLVRYKTRTEVEFETGGKVQGTLIGPDGATLTERRGSSWRPLFQPRTNFDPEMVESVRAIR